MRILSCMNASNPDIPEGVFEDPRSGRLVQQRVVLMMTGVNFNWLDRNNIEGEAEEANTFSGKSNFIHSFMMYAQALCNRSDYL